MCGIYSSIGFKPEQERLDIVTHRGPDGRGWREFASKAGPVALGHRRLSIIDTSDGGAQPMADSEDRYHIIFNGEIYNYLELRHELEQEGEHFATHSDTEVLLRLCMRRGTEALSALRGMFALVFWDDREKRLFAARDRFGIKPLYFAQTPHGVAFASEIKQLIDLPGLERRMNLPRVHDFLAAGMADHTDETMFAGVRQIRAGECAVVLADRRSLEPLTPRRWYAVIPEEIDIGQEEAADRFRDLMTDSIRLHLRADVPIGSCLSGGLDSSSIVCLMAEQLRHDDHHRVIDTVSACYDDKSVDERPFIDTVAQHTRAHSHLVFPKAADVFQTASDVTWHQDEPFGSTSIFAQWCVFAKARSAGVKVMLDGQGADEPLAGYHGFFQYHMTDLARRRSYGTLLRTAVERKLYHGTEFNSQARDFLLPILPDRLSSRLHALYRPAPAHHDWMGSDLLRQHGNRNPSPLDMAAGLLGLPAVTDVRSLSLALTYASNVQLLLHWEDRNSMAHSIEARVPFLDHPLVEFAISLPTLHKIVGGDTKRVLRRAMAKTLPTKVLQRRDKLGFATPEQIWFRGPLRGEVLDGIEATLKRYPGLLNAAAVRSLANDMLEGRRPLDFTLWRIINVGIWGDRFGISL